uniref:BTB domain-containing protein n=1 Tax=Arundo donax TaxID=35708 RepID=A0A0A9D0H8_ARUDO
MGVSSSNLTDAATAVHMFKINGYSATRTMGRTDSLPSKPLAVGGYQWQVHYTPSLVVDGNYWVAFKLVLLAAPRRDDVKAAFRCRPVRPPSSSNSYGTRLRDASGSDNDEAQISHAFKRAEESSGWVPLCKRNALEKSGIIMEDSFTVECTVTVITELPDTVTTANVLQPYTGSQSLHHHLGELLKNGTGSDVTLVVSGESFAAHKAILASRSPVFMA